MGPMETAREAVKAIAPGLSLGKILADVGSEIKQMGAHGTHELAASLFGGGSAFVMYPRQGQDRVDDPQHGLDAQHEQHRGGMEM